MEQSWTKSYKNRLRQRQNFVDWLLIGQRRTKEDEQHMSVD
jgi:hypothetical protein